MLVYLLYIQPLHIIHPPMRARPAVITVVISSNFSHTASVILSYELTLLCFLMSFMKSSNLIPTSRFEPFVKVTLTSFPSSLTVEMSDGLMAKFVPDVVLTVINILLPPGPVLFRRVD